MPLKIAHIITRLILGGAQENTLYTCEGLHARGHQVTLITGPPLGPEGQLLDRAHQGGYQVIELDCLRRAIHPLHDARGYFHLKRLLAHLDPDIVHTHSAKAGILGRYAAHALRQRAAHSCCPAAARFRQAQLAACGRPRIIHTIHGLAFHPYQNPLLNRLYIAAERHAALKTDLLISVADAMTQQALAAGVGRPDQYIRIFSGLEVKPFLEGISPDRRAQIRREFDLPTDALVVAKVARLFDLKGHEYVVDAAALLAPDHPNAYFLFIGGGKLRHDLERQIAHRHLTDRFRFTGLVPPSRIPELLHASDLLVHASLREGLARTLPQALLCGLPAISFDVDGAREVVRHHETGLLIPPKDTNALAKALHQLLSNPTLRHQLGQTGQKLCQKEFDHHLMVDRIEKVYQQQTTRFPAS